MSTEPNGAGYEAIETANLSEKERLIFGYLLKRDDIIKVIKRLSPLASSSMHEDNIDIQQEWKLFIYSICKETSDNFPHISSTEIGIAVSIFCRFAARNNSMKHEAH